MDSTLDPGDGQQPNWVSSQLFSLHSYTRCLLSLSASSVPLLVSPCQVPSCGCRLNSSCPHVAFHISHQFHCQAQVDRDKQKIVSHCHIGRVNFERLDSFPHSPFPLQRLSCTARSFCLRIRTRQRNELLSGVMG